MENRPFFFHCHTKHVNAITVVGNSIISASSDKSIKVSDLRTGELLGVLKGHQDSVSCLFAVQDERHEVKTQNTKTQKHKKTKKQKKTKNKKTKDSDI